MENNIWKEIKPKVMGMYGVLTLEEAAEVRNWLILQGAKKPDIFGYDQPDKIFFVKEDGNVGAVSSSLAELFDIVQLPPTVKYVDLGLPSGTLWADRNYGAEDLFDHGELVGYLQASKIANTCGVEIPKMWQMLELVTECSVSMSSDGNVKTPCIVTGKNGNSIYLPLSGYIPENAHPMEGKVSYGSILGRMESGYYISHPDEITFLYGLKLGNTLGYDVEISTISAAYDFKRSLRFIKNKQ